MSPITYRRPVPDTVNDMTIRGYRITVKEMMLDSEATRLNRGVRTDRMFEKYISDEMTRKHNGRKNASRYVAWRILSGYFSILMREVIDEGATATFEIKNKPFLFFMVADQDKEGKHYRYKFEDDGHRFIPFVYLSRKMYRMCGTTYNMRLSLRSYKRMVKKMKNGFIYEKAPRIKYKDNGCKQKIYGSPKDSGQGLDVCQGKTTGRTSVQGMVPATGT